MLINFLQWTLVMGLAYLCGRIMTKIKMPAILGWLIAGMFLGPHAFNLMPTRILTATGYRTVLTWMQVSFGVMMGSELIWIKLKEFGKPLMVTTLTQSLGTFFVVSLAFGVVLYFMHLPIYIGAVFGSIALATAPAPAISIVSEFHAKGPVTDTLLPMTILDDIVGTVVFFTVNSLIASTASENSLPLYMVLVMIFLPIIIGSVTGLITGAILKNLRSKWSNLVTIILGITITMLMGLYANKMMPQGAELNYMLMGVAFSAIFSNMVSAEHLDKINRAFAPILGISLMASIVDLGVPLDYHLILNAGVTTFVYIVFRAIGKYFGARFGAKIMNMPLTVQKYLGFTLLPHSGVSLVFTGIASATLAGSPEIVTVLQASIAAAAIINEFIAVILAKKGFELAGEIEK